MRARTATETAIICATVVLVIALLTIPFELSSDGEAPHVKGGVAIAVVLGAVIALGIGVVSRHLTIRQRAQIELDGSEKYRLLAEEYRRLADLAITAQEHTDLKLGDVSAQLDYLREQNESLQKILKDVE
jgi:hypothetical protein